MSLGSRQELPNWNGTSRSGNVNVAEWGWRGRLRWISCKKQYKFFAEVWSHLDEDANISPSPVTDSARGGHDTDTWPESRQSAWTTSLSRSQK
jgi:hypothetical protein